MSDTPTPAKRRATPSGAAQLKLRGNKIISVEVSPEERDLIAAAAKADDSLGKVSAFVRRAAIAAAQKALKNKAGK